MGFLADNTVEIELDGQICRVFNQEAEAIVAKAKKMGMKARIVGVNDAPKKDNEK